MAGQRSIRSSDSAHREGTQMTNSLEGAEDPASGPVLGKIRNGVTNR